jgi:hypothetical protein
MLLQEDRPMDALTERDPTLLKHVDEHQSQLADRVVAAIPGGL